MFCVGATSCSVIPSPQTLRSSSEDQTWRQSAEPDFVRLISRLAAGTVRAFDFGPSHRGEFDVSLLARELSMIPFVMVSVAALMQSSCPVDMVRRQSSPTWTLMLSLGKSVGRVTAHYAAAARDVGKF